MSPRTALRRCAARYEREVSRVAARVRRELIGPFCRKHGLSFASGNGTWAFFREGVDYPLTDESDFRRCGIRGYKRVLAALSVPLLGGNGWNFDLGQFVEDVK